MRKFIFLFAGAAVMLCAVLAAGCVTPSVIPSTPAVLDIYFEKTGSIYNVGEVYELSFPSNPTTGYDWNISAPAELIVNQTFVPSSFDLAGTSGQTVFRITSEKAGNYDFTVKYMRVWEGEASAQYTYSDTLIYAVMDEPVMTSPRGTIVITGDLLGLTAGQTVNVSTPVTADTGYVWDASGSQGLGVSAPSTALNLVSWTASAEKAGTYTFFAEQKKPGETSPFATFFFTLDFAAPEGAF